MEAVRLFHLVARWVLILIEAVGMLWLLALLLALLGWAVWGAVRLFTSGRRPSPPGQPNKPAAQHRPMFRAGRPARVRARGAARR